MTEQIPFKTFRSFHSGLKYKRELPCKNMGLGLGRILANRDHLIGNKDEPISPKIKSAIEEFGSRHGAAYADRFNHDDFVIAENDVEIISQYAPVLVALQTEVEALGDTTYGFIIRFNDDWILENISIDEKERADCMGEAGCVDAALMAQKWLQCRIAEFDKGRWKQGDCLAETKLKKENDIVYLIVEELEGAQPAKVQFKGQSHADLFIDELLADMLGGALPVARYRTSFFIPLHEAHQDNGGENLIADKDELSPLLLKMNAQSNTAWQKVQSSEDAEEYFTREMRRVITGIQPDGVDENILTSYANTDIAGKWAYRIFDTDKFRPVTIPIKAIWLHFNCEDVVIAEIECSWNQTPRDGDLSDQALTQKFENISDEHQLADQIFNFNDLSREGEFANSWWKELISSNNCEDYISLANVMMFNSIGRVSKFSFHSSSLKRELIFDVNEHGNDCVQECSKCLGQDQKAGPLFTAVFNRALGCEKEDQPSVFDKYQLNFLSDHRSFVFSSLILEGSRLNAEKREILLSRMGMVDDYGEGFAYGHREAKADLNAFIYDRYWNWGTYYLISDHSFIFCSFRNESSNSNNRNISYSEHKIHGNHMANHYRHLTLFALFIRYRLAVFSSHVSKANELVKEDHHALSFIKKKFLNFKANMWTYSPTTELQGMELYDHLKEKLRLSERMEEIQSRLSEYEQFQSLEAQKSDAMLKSLIYYLGFPLLFIGFFLPKDTAKWLATKIQLPIDALSSSSFDIFWPGSSHALKLFAALMVSTLVSMIVLRVTRYTLSIGKNKRNKIHDKTILICVLSLLVLVVIANY